MEIWSGELGVGEGQEMERRGSDWLVNRGILHRAIRGATPVVLLLWLRNDQVTSKSRNNSLC
jgi:hypothetical protein